MTLEDNVTKTIKLIKERLSDKELSELKKLALINVALRNYKVRRVDSEDLDLLFKEGC